MAGIAVRGSGVNSGELQWTRRLAGHLVIWVVYNSFIKSEMLWALIAKGRGQTIVIRRFEVPSYDLGQVGSQE